MPDLRKLLGVLIGTAVAWAILAAGGLRRQTAFPEQRGWLLSESRGALEEVVIHYVRESASAVEKTYSELLAQLPAEVNVHVLCPDAASWEDFQRRFGAARGRCNGIVVGHAMTMWSRDRWAALADNSRNGPLTLWLPRGEQAAEQWPARAGDERTGEDLAAALAPRVRAVRSPLYFDGGDFVADDEMVFVTPAVLRRNLQRTVEAEDQLLRTLESAFGRRVVLLKKAPDHHAAMFMMLAGSRTAVVGDPGLARRLLEAAGRAQGRLCPCGDDLGPGPQRLCDAVAAQCAAAGYRVLRVPTVAGLDGKTYLTYVNVLLETRGGSRVVYLPQYRGADVLNSAAAGVWSGLGFRVVGVDCTDLFPHFGTLHCVVNVLRRGE